MPGLFVRFSFSLFSTESRNLFQTRFSDISVRNLQTTNVISKSEDTFQQKQRKIAETMIE
jgi:hypothetical protein